MRGKLMFVAGAAAGYILGTRAGRERYEDLKTAARKVLDNPSVQEATGVAQAQATKLYTKGKDTLANTSVGDRILHATGRKDTDDFLDAGHQSMSSNSF
jgi:hypothetical protein